jgi:hypothetical protein
MSNNDIIKWYDYTIGVPIICIADPEAKQTSLSELPKDLRTSVTGQVEISGP